MLCDDPPKTTELTAEVDTEAPISAALTGTEELDTSLKTL